MGQFSEFLPIVVEILGAGKWKITDVYQSETANTLALVTSQPDLAKLGQYRNGTAQFGILVDLTEKRSYGALSSTFTCTASQIKYTSEGFLCQSDTEEWWSLPKTGTFVTVKPLLEGLRIYAIHYDDQVLLVTDRKFFQKNCFQQRFADSAGKLIHQYIDFSKVFDLTQANSTMIVSLVYSHPEYLKVSQKRFPKPDPVLGQLGLLQYVNAFDLRTGKSVPLQMPKSHGRFLNHSLTMLQANHHLTGKFPQGEALCLRAGRTIIQVQSPGWKERVRWNRDVNPIKNLCDSLDRVRSGNCIWMGVRFLGNPQVVIERMDHHKPVQYQLVRHEGFYDEDLEDFFGMLAAMAPMHLKAEIMRYLPDLVNQMKFLWEWLSQLPTVKGISNNLDTHPTTQKILKAPSLEEGFDRVGFWERYQLWQKLSKSPYGQLV